MVATTVVVDDSVGVVTPFEGVAVVAGATVVEEAAGATVVEVVIGTLVASREARMSLHSSPPVNQGPGIPNG